MSDQGRTLGPQERLLLLKTLTIADGLPAAALIPLAEYAEERTFPRGTVVVEQDQDLAGVLIVVEGTLEYSSHGRTLGPLSETVIGALEVMAGQPSQARLTATSDVLVLDVPSAALFEVYEDHFGMFLGTLRSLASALLAAGPELAMMEAPPVSPHVGDVDDFVYRLDLLRDNPVFAHSRLESLIRFAALLEPFRAAAGERLWRLGDQASWVLFVADGRIQCQLADGRHFIQGPGAYVGSIEPFAAHERWFDATATDAVVGLRMSIERFVDVLEDDFSLARDVLREFARSLLALNAAAKAEPGQASEP